VEPTHEERAVDERAPVSSARVLLRYAALQLPGQAACIAIAVVAHDWLGLSRELAIGAVVVWVAKDILLFPFVRKAYEPSTGRSPRDVRDAIGVAHQGLEDEGYVRIGPELWRARRRPGCSRLAPGEAIRVVDVSGLTVTVDRYEPAED
jgi:membrane protein implicated in regulation of membrane protease activity